MNAAELSMPALAERMGVSVQALYRHVSGRDEVLQLLNRQALATMEAPPLDGRHWSDWLLDYARAWREVLLRCPGTISHVDIGGPGTPTSLDNAERAYEVLEGAGFSDSEAMETFHLLGRLIVGWVTGELEYQAAARSGNPYRRFYEELARRRADEVPIMRRLSLVWPRPEETFDEAVRTLLAGVAARRRLRRRNATTRRVRKTALELTPAIPERNTQTRPR
jgi:AcrR family transcriptional regulator